MAWGLNSSGQLGDGTTTQRLTPVQVSGITTAVAVAAGGNSSYALLADGSVKAWGNNTSGQLGDGTTTNRLTPVQISGLTGGAVSIDGGNNNGYALLADGSVRAWGENLYGQIGDGTTIQRNTPVTPINLTAGSGVVQIAGGLQHAAALKADGTVLSWGDNQYGQLGNGTSTNNSTPTATTISNVTQIKSSIGYVTYARQRDGSLYAWGYNANGEVGNGTTATPRTMPVRVSIDAGIGFFGANANGGYAGSPLTSVATGAQFVRLGDATVNFPNVATAGTLQIRTFDSSTSGLTVPSGYTIEANSNGYDITSTAQFTGNAQVCLKVSSEIDQTTFNKLTILHDDNFDGILDAVQVTKNYQKREVCRVTQSFSPFVLAQGLVPTSASVSVSGIVKTPEGRALLGAVVIMSVAEGNTRRTLSSSFGYYSFDNVAVGQTVIVQVASKRFQFAPQVVTVEDEMTGVNFTGQ
jgi:Regulator of chromosome condensation (RCC1) repeat